jgi:hypothetical protein
MFHMFPMQSNIAVARLHRSHNAHNAPSVQWLEVQICVIVDDLVATFASERRVASHAWRIVPFNAARTSCYDLG